MNISEETRLKMRNAKLGKKQSDKHCQNISKAMSGRTLSESHKANLSGEKSHNWVGEKVGYQGVHGWIRRQLGKPSLCVHCDRTDQKRYEWANVSGEYHRNVKDFIRLCSSCHKHYDMTDTTRHKLHTMAIGNTNRRRAVISADKKGGYKNHVSIEHAAKEIGILSTSIKNCLAGRTKTAGGFKWKYGDIS